MNPKEVPFIDIHTHKDNSGWIFSLRSKSLRVASTCHPFATLANAGLAMTFGIHPWSTSLRGAELSGATWQSNLTGLITLLKENQLAAIGETGLDRLHADTYELQLEVFEQHILLSEEYKKPLIIHCVKAIPDVLRLHKKHQPLQTWIIHGFNGNADEIRQLTQRGICLSVGESIFYPNRKITKHISSISLEYLFLETDTSEKTIQQIYAKAAELLNLPLDRLKQQIFANFARLNLTPWKTGNNVHDCSSATMALINLGEAMC